MSAQQNIETVEGHLRGVRSRRRRGVHRGLHRRRRLGRPTRRSRLAPWHGAKHGKAEVPSFFAGIGQTGPGHRVHARQLRRPTEDGDVPRLPAVRVHRHRHRHRQGRRDEPPSPTWRFRDGKVDSLPRVRGHRAHRFGARRLSGGYVTRPRRAATVVVSAAVVAASATAGAGAYQVHDGLTFTRPDGTVVAFSRDVRVWCGPWESGVPVRSIHVQVGGRKGGWRLSAVIADVRRHPVVRMPHSFVFDKPTGALLFAFEGGNELSSQEEESRGTIRFKRARCGKRPRVTVTVGGRIGSEFFDGESLTVSGNIRRVDAVDGRRARS